MNDVSVDTLNDLASELDGELRTDAWTTASYATDASLLQIRPMAVVFPKSTEDLVRIVRFATDQNLPIHPRGAGTGLAGESLGPGLVVETRQCMNRILDIGSDRVRVEPGVTWAALRDALAESGRQFAPDPISGDRCTLGGMVATDAAGPHSLRYGTTGDHLLRVEGVLASGEVIPLGLEPRQREGRPPKLDRLARELIPLLERNSATIAREQPPHWVKPGGYNLRNALSDGRIDLARLMAGSEGTLALFASLELATLPMVSHRGILLAGFSSLEHAAGVVAPTLAMQPSACELIDRRLLAVAREADPRYQEWIPEAAEALLLFEQEGTSEANVRDRLRLLSATLEREAIPLVGSVELWRAEEVRLAWAMRGTAASRLTQRTARQPPVAVAENIAIPPGQLPQFLRRVQDIMKRHEVTAVVSGHAGVGILHVRPLLDLARTDHRDKLVPITEDLLDATIESGGTFHAEHGVGLLRSGYLHRQYPALQRLFPRIKAIFDPKEILNPGRLTGSERGFPSEILRPVTAPAPIKTQLAWTELSVLETARACNGCGSCETLAPANRMCPSFKVAGTELSAPRSKANLFRQLLSGELDPAALSSDEFRGIADYCVNCKMCRVECPSGVDISKLMLEAKASNVAEHGLSRADWFFSHLEGWARFASQHAPWANLLCSSLPFRWLGERFWGLARERPIPRFHHRTFLRRAAREGWTRMPRAGERRPRVAFLADLFVQYNDPHLGELAVRVLEHAGYKVYVPPSQRGSGMAALQHGDVDRARASLEWNLNLFSELARDGFDIVTPEPAAAIMFREEAKNLVAGADLDLVVERTFEFSEFLAVLARAGKLPTVTQPIPLSVAYHEPCHERALGPRAPIEPLFAAIPSLHLLKLDLGCSGMAGTYGLRRDSYRASMQVGAPLGERLRRGDVEYSTAQCSACRLQLEHLSGKRALHPAHWFAIAYDLVQRPENLLRPKNRRPR